MPVTVIPFTPKPKPPAFYTITEYDYVDLMQLRDHLKWMAKLTAANPNMPVQELRRGITWWVRQVEKQLDTIIKASEGSAKT
jgi:hypothetical protein